MSHITAAGQRGWTTVRHACGAAVGYRLTHSSCSNANSGVEYRWAVGDAERRRKYAAELVAHAPDVMVSGGLAAAAALQQASRNIPIVIGNISDPVGAGLVASLAQPGGNSTGFMTSEFSFSAKWLELLKQIAPG